MFSAGNKIRRRWPQEDAPPFEADIYAHYSQASIDYRRDDNTFQDWTSARGTWTENQSRLQDLGAGIPLTMQLADNAGAVTGARVPRLSQNQGIYQQNPQGTNSNAGRTDVYVIKPDFTGVPLGQFRFIYDTRIFTDIADTYLGAYPLNDGSGNYAYRYFREADGLGSNTNLQITAGTAASPTLDLIVVRWNNAGTSALTSYIYVKNYGNASVNRTFVNDFTPSSFYWGYIDNPYGGSPTIPSGLSLAGDLYEMIFYNRNLSDAEVTTDLYNYFNTKYGI